MVMRTFNSQEGPSGRHQQEDQTHMRRHRTFMKILENRIHREHQTRKNNFLKHVRNETVVIEAPKKGIVDTFAKFYEDWQSSRIDQRKMSKTKKEDLSTTAVMLTKMKKMKMKKISRREHQQTTKDSNWKELTRKRQK